MMPGELFKATSATERWYPTLDDWASTGAGVFLLLTTELGNGDKHLHEALSAGHSTLERVCNEAW